MGRKPLHDRTMRQSALRLPVDLYERLNKVAGERGMGEEIRRRLEASFAAEKSPDDPATKRLLDAIAHVASRVPTDALWSKDAYSFAIFRAAIDALLTHFRPAGDATPARRLLFGPDDPPETIGRTLASFALHERMKASDK